MCKSVEILKSFYHDHNTSSCVPCTCERNINVVTASTWKAWFIHLSSYELTILVLKVGETTYMCYLLCLRVIVVYWKYSLQKMFCLSLLQSMSLVMMHPKSSCLNPWNFN
jgi:hypothetical protein